MLVRFWQPVTNIEKMNNIDKKESDRGSISGKNCQLNLGMSQ
jgi:hypothetical protein